MHKNARFNRKMAYLKSIGYNYFLTNDDIGSSHIEFEHKRIIIGSSEDKNLDFSRFDKTLLLKSIASHESNHYIVLCLTNESGALSEKDVWKLVFADMGFSKDLLEISQLCLNTYYRDMLAEKDAKRLMSRIRRKILKAYLTFYYKVFGREKLIKKVKEIYGR